MRVVIETLPHEEQRYPTAGDWWVDEVGTWQIRVSELGNEKMEFLIGIHELVEMALCLNAGITTDEVDEFDKQYEERRSENDSVWPWPEPGDDKSSPYYHQHQYATGVERQLAAELHVDWDEYDKVVQAL
jgi:hypothetical protein